MNGAQTTPTPARAKTLRGGVGLQREVTQTGCQCQGVEFGSYDNQICLQRPAHMATGRTDDGGTLICVDTCLAEEVAGLWRLGVHTTGCCCGHHKAPGYIGVVDADIDRMLSLDYEVLPHPSFPSRRDSFVPKSV